MIDQGAQTRSKGSGFLNKNCFGSNFMFRDLPSNQIISLNFQPPSLISNGQRRPGGRLQRLAVRQDFPVGKVGDEILAHFRAKSARPQNKSIRARFQKRASGVFFRSIPSR
jgi:hypothetical protein